MLKQQQSDDMSNARWISMTVRSAHISCQGKTILAQKFWEIETEVPIWPHLNNKIQNEQFNFKQKIATVHVATHFGTIREPLPFHLKEKNP